MFVCVWGGGEQDWEDILWVSKSISSEVELTIAAGRLFRSRLETVEFHRTEHSFSAGLESLRQLEIFTTASLATTRTIIIANIYLVLVMASYYSKILFLETEPTSFSHSDTVREGALILPIFFFFWLCHGACGISVPHSAPSPHHWTAREFPVIFPILQRRKLSDRD